MSENLCLEASNNSFLPHNYQVPPDPRDEFSNPITMSLSSWVSSLLFYSFADCTETLKCWGFYFPKLLGMKVTYASWSGGAYFSYRNDDSGQLPDSYRCLTDESLGFRLMNKTHEHRGPQKRLSVLLYQPFPGISATGDYFPMAAFMDLYPYWSLYVLATISECISIYILFKSYLV